VKLCGMCSMLVLSISTGATAQEPKPSLSCAGLALTLRADIDRMRKLQVRAKKEEKAPPADLLSAWQRSFGKKGDGVPYPSPHDCGLTGLLGSGGSGEAYCP